MLLLKIESLGSRDCATIPKLAIGSLCIDDYGMWSFFDCEDVIGGWEIDILGGILDELGKLL